MSLKSDGSQSDSSYDVDACLSNLILRSATKSVFQSSDREFYPVGSIESLMTREAVIKELCMTEGDLNHDTNIRLLDFILSRGNRVFAILLDIGLTKKKLKEAIRQFSNVSLGDASLPISSDNIDNIPFLGENSGRMTKPWTPRLVKSFRWKQFEYLAPTFSDDNLDMKLHHLTIFPFISQDKDRKAGAFGEVSQVEIHPSHHKNPILTFNGKRSKTAVKQITSISSSDEAKIRILEAAWQKEVNAHIDINKCNNGKPHPNIIEFVAAVTKGDGRFLLFRWADGGNLQEFWQANRKPQMSVSLVREVVTQLRGLADALEKLHTYGGGAGSYRHGDVKPENILRVRTKNVEEGKDTDLDVGILKIADMGLAKHHTVLTEFRPPTSAKYSTLRYEPPEIVLESATSSGGRSRRQDIWSFGCVTLELIIWLLYGTESLNDFNKTYVIDQNGQLSSYFETEKVGNKMQARVHRAVSETMDILSRDQECQPVQCSAIKDLLQIVRNKLLVVDLTSVVGGPVRATAGELCTELEAIVRNGEANESYWFTGRSRNRNQRLAKLRSSGTDFLAPVSTLGQTLPGPNTPTMTTAENITFDFSTPSVSHGSYNEYRSAIKIDITSFPVDNKFAQKVVETPGVEVLFPKHQESANRCVRCAGYDFFEPGFKIVDSWADLKSNMDACDFCNLRWEVSNHLIGSGAMTVTFTRDQSMLRLNEGRIPVLSICRSPAIASTNANYIQIGFPVLPEAASKSHFDIVRHFIQDCDANHERCVPPKNSPLPTRLLDLGAPESPIVRLIKTKEGGDFRYTALSHPWGPGPDYFCTYQSNLNTFEESIAFDDLPNTFKHAVEATREINVRYLWIDSLCIIQGDDGDFEQEKLRMEDVFSSAYCVIAASSARSPKDGFLIPREKNKFLTFDKAGEPLYICKYMDDFETHVLRGPLSKRGWVMQERALAHRTVFFTGTQTYFECGGGVRCETLTKMENQLISFLGDPKFPSKIANETSDRGARIRLYEDFYRQYSRLDFTRWSDRPIAIAGLQNRLLSDLNVRGGFGVFDDQRSFLSRSLLWRKDPDVSSLERITLVSGEPLPVPSWSWMGYKGAIDYLDMPLGGMDWTADRLFSPWVTQANSSESNVGNMDLTATARSFKVGPSHEDSFGIHYDMKIPSDDELKALQCVVLGWEKGVGRTTIEEMMHYVLVVKPKSGTESTRRGKRVYERVGVGCMAGRYIDLTAAKSPQLVVVQ